MKKTIVFLFACLITIAAKAQSNDMSQYAPKLAVGTEAPEIVLPRYGGKGKVKLSDFRGEYVLVDFWATWCGDCRREMPIMREALEEYKGKIKVLSVSFDRKPEQLKDYLDKNPTDWTVVADFTPWKESAVTKAYQLNWIPTFYIVDPEGKIAGGGITGEELKSELKRLPISGNTQRPIRVLYIGDSITDGGWGRSGGSMKSSDERSQKDQNHVFGHGYMEMSAAALMADNPGRYECFNRGISGNTLADLEARWQKDCLDLQPDVISILVGTNDVNNGLGKGFDVKEWENRYDALLTKTEQALNTKNPKLKTENPKLKLILCTPFVAKAGKVGAAATYSERDSLIRECAKAVERLAKKHNAALVPFGKMLDNLLKETNVPASYWIWDGIHPTSACHKKMADLWLERTTDGVYTKQFPAQKMQAGEEWAKRGEWRNGFTANPHPSVNLAEFREQYEKNREQWDAAFRWLATHDLQTIEKGKHPIEGTSLVASVEDSENGPLAKRKSESHREKIDFQFCVKGTERFAILDHVTSKPDGAYKPDVQRYSYELDRTLFYDSNPNEFFLFFPDDWHIAKVSNDGQDQTIRVIVIKIDYK